MSVSFKGVKEDATIGKVQMAELEQYGHTHIRIGTWEDGTPAFVKLSLLSQAQSKDKAE